MIFQDDWLFPHLNVAANIRFGLKGWPRDQADARLAEVAALCGVERSAGPRAGDALRRRAAAGRPGPGAGASAPALALRRAGLRPRPGQPPRAARAPSRRPARPGDPDALRHSQSRRGHRPGLAAVPAGSKAGSSPRDRRWTCSARLGTRRGGSIAWEGVRNVFPARVVNHAPEHERDPPRSSTTAPS